MVGQLEEAEWLKIVLAVLIGVSGLKFDTVNTHSCYIYMIKCREVNRNVVKSSAKVSKTTVVYCVSLELLSKIDR